MSLTQEIKNLAMVDIFAEAKKADLFIGRPYYLDFDKAYLLITDAWKEKVGGIPQGTFLLFLNEHHAIYLVGLEKSGSFVEHAVQASKRMLPKQMLLLGNSYIYKYIIPGNGRDNEPYASSSYYGHKVIFKSEHNNVYVATIPNTQAKVEPQIDDYININEILYNITALKCDLYYNSLVPVVLANKLVSLADHPSSDLLKSFAKEKINK